MKALVASLLLFFQAGQGPDKWECREGAEPLSKEELVSVIHSELKERVESCSLPHLPGDYCGQGTVLIEVQVNEDGNVGCARPISGGDQIMRRAAVEAAMKWTFKPLAVDGKAKPYRSFLTMIVHWAATESAKSCPKEKRRA